MLRAMDPDRPPAASTARASPPTSSSRSAPGINGVLALGSTGEFPFFTVDERKQMLATSPSWPRRCRFCQHHGHPSQGRNRARAVAPSRSACRRSRLMPPVFFPVSQADMLAYFLHVADASGCR